MKDRNPHTLKLILPARPSYLHIATDFAQASASAFGLGKEECLQLGLAVEEIFMHLSRTVGPEQPLEMHALDGVYDARIQFLFSAGRFNLGGLNIATDLSSVLSGHSEPDLEEMGLILASRSVEHLNISMENDNPICLSITKEKKYPEGSAPGRSSTRGYAEMQAVTETIPVTAGPEDLKALAAGVTSGRFPFAPRFFRYPGKVVDMVASGKYQAVTALDQRKGPVGGALFRFLSDRIVEIFGPYIFESAGETAAERILEECLRRMARTKALGLLSLSGLPLSLRDSFESLGFVEYFTAEGSRMERPVFYRLLHEDPGSEAWTHGDYTSWLREEYDRLVLARDIRMVQPMGENRSGASLFAAEINRELLEVVLRPIWPGEDLAVNVGRHVSFLRKEAFLNIFFELDLGIPWHSELMPALGAHGFKPRLLLPFAGKSDIVVFQYDAT